MLKKIIKEIIKSKLKHRHYSSSDYKRKRYRRHPSHYGHKYYKRKYKSSRSSGFFRSYSSS